MDKLHRITALIRVLKSRHRPVSLQQLSEALECSPSTARRLLHCYRDDYNAPVIFDRKAGGWKLVQDGTVAEEVPGSWFSPEELYALMAARELLRQLEPSLLSEEISPIAARIEHLLAARGIGLEQIAKRIRLLRTGARSTPGPVFVCLARALIDRNRVRLLYRNRGRTPEGPSEASKAPREVSPQRLTWYRGNWYLDAWCHRADGLRRFAVERIETEPQVMSEFALEIDEALLEKELGSGFGIFSGSANEIAVLRFNRYRARWVSEELWHPQ